MASLLLWWSCDGAPIDDVVWQQLCERAARAQGFDRAKAHLIIGHGYRALAARTLRAEAEPLVCHEPKFLALAASRHRLSRPDLFSERHTEPTALVRLEPEQGRLTLTRDLLGLRHLVWTQIQGGYLVSTCEEPLLAHPKVSRRWNLAHIAAMLDSSPPEESSTPFVMIRSVAAGTTVELTREGAKIRRSPLEPCEDLGGWKPEALSARFRELLEASVQRAVRGAARLGVTLSAGLDAASIAAIALRLQEPAHRILAVTYGYSNGDGADLDEREPVQSFCRQMNIELDTFDASKIPLSFTLEGGWSGPAGMVSGNAFRELKTEVYRRLEHQRVDVVLAGHGADQLATLSANWIWSAWTRGDYAWIARGLAEYLRTIGLWQTLRKPSLRRFLKCMLFGREAILSSSVSRDIPVKLRSVLAQARAEEISRYKAWPDPARAALHFNAYECADYALESLNAEKHGLDIRSPYRDWDLVQFVLSTPLHLMAGPLGYKWLQKQAISQYLPADWISRAKCGNLTPIFETHLNVHRERICSLLHREREHLSQVSAVPDDLGTLTNIDPYRSVQLAQFVSWAKRHPDVVN